MAPVSAEGAASPEPGYDAPAPTQVHEAEGGNNGSDEAPQHAPEREPRAPAPAREYHAEPRESAAAGAAPLAHFEPTPRHESAAPEDKPYVVWSSAPAEKPPGATGRAVRPRYAARALLAQVRQQSPCGDFHQVENFLEAVGATVIRIGHLAGILSAGQTPGTAARARARRRGARRRSTRRFSLVHRQNQVKAHEVRRLHHARAQRLKVIAAPRRRRAACARSGGSPTW